MEREILYADIAAFAVTLERMVHPELRRRPVVIAPVGSPRAVVTALSREAWESGVRKGMLVAKARKYCRGVAVLPPNEPLYVRASNAVCRVLNEFSPVLEPSGYGHAYLDITGTRRLFGPARDAAWRAQKEIRERLRLETSFGVASNKMVSKIAAAVTKPVGLQEVPTGDERSFLSPLPVGLLPGVGPRAQEQLHELNIRLIQELAALATEYLTLAFGRLGFLLHQRALGIDNTPVYPPAAVPTVALDETLPEDTNDIALLKQAVLQLCRGAAEHLRTAGLGAGRIELRVRYSDYREDSGRARPAVPVRSAPELCDRAGVLLERIVSRRTRVRAVGLRLTELAAGPSQLELFPDPAALRREKLEALRMNCKSKEGHR
jgi:DNA polymerase IV